MLSATLLWSWYTNFPISYFHGLVLYVSFLFFLDLLLSNAGTLPSHFWSCSMSWNTQALVSKASTPSTFSTTSSTLPDYSATPTMEHSWWVGELGCLHWPVYPNQSTGGQAVASLRRSVNRPQFTDTHSHRGCAWQKLPWNWISGWQILLRNLKPRRAYSRSLVFTSMRWINVIDCPPDRSE